MRKLILACLMCLFCGISLIAQDDKTTEFNSNSRDRVILELNYTGWYASNPAVFDSVQLKWYNRGINLFFMWDIPLGSKTNSRFSFAPGIGLSMHNVYSNSRPDIAEILDEDGEVLRYESALRPIRNSFKNNKLATTYLEAPLELRYRSKPNDVGRSWKLALGLRFAYRFHSNAKYKGTIINQYGFDEQVKTKQIGVSYINKYRIGPSVRIGYGNISLVGYMSLTGLFEVDRGPKLQPFSIGISFNSF